LAAGGAVASTRGAGALDDRRTLRLVPENTRLDVGGGRLIAFTLAAPLLVVTVIALAVHGLNLGIDFQGGILLEARAHEPFELAALPARLSGLPAASSPPPPWRYRERWGTERRRGRGTGGGEARGAREQDGQRDRGG
jgi:hypothetical protein